MQDFMAFAGTQPLLSTVWCSLVLAIIVLTIRIKMSPIKQLNPQELTFSMNKEGGVVVDIRNEKDYRTAHILDAKHLSTEKVNKNDFTSLEKLKAKPIIVVCAQGMTATKVANQLLKAGFSQVNLLKGGMAAWTGAGLPVAKKK